MTTIDGQERNVRELKSLIYELTAQLSGTIETATTAIQFETDDVEIERAALMFKAEAVPALLHASFRHDPIMAVADISLLTFQLQDWATTGPGRNAFGEMQHTAIEATQKMERQIIEFLEIESSQVAEDDGVLGVVELPSDQDLVGIRGGNRRAVEDRVLPIRLERFIEL